MAPLATGVARIAFQVHFVLTGVRVESYEGFIETTIACGECSS